MSDIMIYKALNRYLKNGYTGVVYIVIKLLKE